MQNKPDNGWDYKISPELIPWSSRARNPHTPHLEGTDGARTAEMMARTQLGVHPVLPVIHP